MSSKDFDLDLDLLTFSIMRVFHILENDATRGEC
jgi:hypothetical protein